MTIAANLKRQLCICKAVAIVTYKEWAAYRTHSMISIFVGPCYYLVQMFIWRAIYSQQATVNGMSLENMLKYFGVVALIGYITMDFADWNLQMLIRTGKYLNFAMKPMHHRFFALSQKLGHRTLGLLYEFIPVLLIFTLIFRVPLAPTNYPLALLSVTFSFLINFFVNYSIGLTGFWFTQTNGLRSVYHLLVGIFSGTLLPLSFFPEAIHSLIFYLPFQYISYVPAMVWTGSYSLGSITMPLSTVVAIQGIYVVIAYAISELLYRLGHKRFNGVGA